MTSLRERVYRHRRARTGPGPCKFTGQEDQNAPRKKAEKADRWQGSKE